jgi:hypothetical protein
MKAREEMLAQELRTAIAIATTHAELARLGAKIVYLDDTEANRLLIAVQWLRATDRVRRAANAI